MKRKVYNKALREALEIIEAQREIIKKHENGEVLIGVLAEKVELQEKLEQRQNAINMLRIALTFQEDRIKEIENRNIELSNLNIELHNRKLSVRAKNVLNWMLAKEA